MKRIIKIFAVVFALVATMGCFQEEKQGTRMRVALYSQNVTSDPILKTEHDIEAYAFYVDKGTKWKVETWEDALNRVITNEDNASITLSQPEVFGDYDPMAEYQLTLELWSQYTYIVVVDHTTKIYATRLYETPMNLPEVMVQLHLYAHKKSGSANGWTVTNPFPDEARDPLVPEEEEENDEESNQQKVE